MANLHDQQAMILENLQDAGCDEHLCQEILHYLYGTQIPYALCLLRQHKKQLLARLHDNEYKIDRLDYFMYQLNRMANNQKG